ncbi:YraN family protein [Clostridium sp. Cult3]|uniref:YraN family protein n=1 Tax=Clostridium sp. Cult3 TaxID=2079004 RepID=UPI001F00D273|nr:YraN family protein [Clostridium sp. Cult3]MCF6460560.1 YraN family protein [Clostridium sp. Cult3]
MTNNIHKGFQGENIAIKYLISNGYNILDRNYRTNIGEIDIIAIKSNILTFIEVKTRTSVDYGYPYEAVNFRKQDKIIKTSFVYIKQKNLFDYQVRYDIIEVFLSKKSKINHIENAFC